MAVKPIPDHYHSVIPYLHVKGVAQFIDFAKAALGAEEIMRMWAPDGAEIHAEISIRDSRLFLSEAVQTAPSCSSFYLFVNDVDAAYKRAVGAGATSQAEPRDQLWGDRVGIIRDSFGNTWSLATRKEEPTLEEIAGRMSATVR